MSKRIAVPPKPQPANPPATPAEWIGRQESRRLPTTPTLNSLSALPSIFPKACTGASKSLALKEASSAWRQNYGEFLKNIFPSSAVVTRTVRAAYGITVVRPINQEVIQCKHNAT